MSGPFVERSIAPHSVLPKRFWWEIRDIPSKIHDMKLTRSLIPFARAHSSSSWGSASPLYSASSRVCNSVKSLGFCRELRRCWVRKVANWLRRFTPQFRIIKDSSFEENACLEGWTVQVPCWREPSNTGTRISTIRSVDPHLTLTE
jgi:hypothetical protein